MAEPDQSNKDDADEPTSWLESHGDALFAFAMIRISNRDIAEDLVQDTLVSAIQSRESFAGNSTIRTWLIGILKRKIIDHFRREQVREKGRLHKEEQAVEEHAPEAFFKKNGYWVDGVGRWSENPSQIIESREFWQVFQKCREKLPALLHSVFVLREIEQQSKEETCNQLGISPSNLSVRLFRARMNLRRCLETNWFNRE